MKNISKLAALIWLLFHGIASADQAVDLNAADWQVYMGTGTLGNVDDPTLGQSVLSAQSTNGTSFGYTQTNYASRRYDGRYVRFRLKSPGSFLFYVRVHATDGKDYYLSYSSYLRPFDAGSNGYLNYTLAADYPARYEKYQTYTVDARRDLERLLPGVSLAWIRWFAVRGPANFADITVANAVDYLTTDTDGDLLTGVQEDALGTSPFLADTDGDGFFDGMEFDHPCGAALDPGIPTSAVEDADGDGISSAVEIYLKSHCEVADNSLLPMTYGWGVYFTMYVSPAQAQITNDVDGGVVLSHPSTNPLAVGILNPTKTNLPGIPDRLRVSRSAVSFSVKSSEVFYIYFRVAASDGNEYYISYNPGNNAPAYGGNGYVVYSLGSEGYSFSGANYTLVERDLDADLSAMLSGVTVKSILWVAARGRFSLKDVTFVRTTPEITSVNLAEATGGNTLVVSGRHFGATGTVTLGGLGTEIVSWAPTEIRVKVSNTIDSGIQPLLVESAGVLSSPYYISIVPNLLGASFPSAVSDQTIALTGTNFGSTWGVVEYSAGALTIEDWTNTSITIRIQPTDAPGLHSVRVWQNGVYSQPLDLTISPSVFRLQPPEFMGGTPRLLGGNFGQTAGTVTVGGVPATPSMWSPTAVEFYPPPPFDVPGGTLPVVLTTADGQSTAPQMLTIEPEVWGVSPLIVRAGDMLTIDGGYLEIAQGNVAVGPATASILDWAPTQIHATVPATAGPGSRDVVVTTISGRSPLMPPPAVTVKPAFDMPMFPEDIQKGRAGDLLTMPGSNFGATQGTGDVFYIDGLPATPVSWSMTAISFIVPSNLTGPWHSVNVDAGGQSSDAVPFTVMPGIVSVAPGSAYWGDSVTIQGSLFGSPYNSANMWVTVGEWTVSQGDIVSWADDAITFIVPFGVAAGAQPVSVTNYGETSNQANLTVRPKITGVAPVLLQPGQPLRIQGQAFGMQQDASTLLIGGVEVVPTAWSDWEIQAQLPPDVAPGNVAISVVVNGVASNTVQSTVTPPIPFVYWVDAPPGAPGAPLYIYGVNFGASQGDGRVVVGGLVAPVAAWSDGYIEAAVPAAAPGGAVPVSVIVGGVSEYIVPAPNPWSIQGGTPNQLVPLVANGDAGVIADVRLDLEIEGWGVYQWDVVLDAPDATVLPLVNNGTSLGTVSTFDSPTPSVAPFDSLDGMQVNGNWGLRFGDYRSSWDPAISVNAYLRFTTDLPGLQSVPFNAMFAPKITSVLPAVGAPLTNVMVSGTGFGPAPSASGGIFIGGVPALVNSWSETAIEIVVPDGMPGGPAPIYVQTDWGMSNEAPFTVVTGLYISDVSPSNAVYGTLLTVTGGNFGPVDGINRLFIGGMPVHVESWSDTVITAKMPNHVTAGTRDVRVARLLERQGDVSTFQTAGGPMNLVDAATTFSPLEVQSVGGVLNDVEVMVDLTHTWPTNLVITLRHPDGTAVVLQKNTFDDPKTTFGLYTLPLQALRVLDGKAPNGVWTLEVSDVASGGGRVLNGWGLKLWTNGGIPGGAPEVTQGYTPIDVPLTSYYQMVASSSINVPDSATITGVQLSINIAGDIGDARMQLRHPDGTVVRLGWPDYWLSSLVTTFDTLTVPVEPLANFNGKSAAGSWTLELVDPYGCGCRVFTINDWNLQLTTSNGAPLTEYSNALPIVVAPSLDAGAVQSVNAGQPSSFYGWNFGDGYETGRVLTVGGIAVNDTTWVNGSPWSWVSGTVPAALVAGMHDVVVTVGGQSSAPVSIITRPFINSTSASYASGGAIVTLSGAGYGASQGASTVTLGGLVVPVVSWSHESISIQVPNDHPPGLQGFVVTVNGIASTAKDITVRPAITSVNPANVTGGDEIEILGTNFGATQGASIVYIESGVATATSWSNNRITALVPNATQAGTYRRVRVSVNGALSLFYEITVRPNILTVSPAASVVGASITITGTNFGTAGSLTIGGWSAATSSWTSGQIVATIPAGLAPGSQPIVVNVGAATDSDVITIAPALISISPPSGPAGATITLTGTSFGNPQGASQLLIDGAPVAVNAWTNTSITAVVPAGLAFGDYPVVVRVGGIDSNALTYSVIPYITGTDVVTGTGGTEVTISGSGFGAVQGTSAVKFGSIDANVVSWSSTVIVAVVPDTVAAGSVSIVVALDTVVSNASPFMIRPSITGIDQVSATGGDQLVLTGTNLGASQGTSTLTVGGVSATVVSWSMLDITFVVPSTVAGGPQPVVATVSGQASVPYELRVLPHLLTISPTTVFGTGNVTVTGTNFGAAQGASAVGINMTPGTVVSWSNTSIVFTPPTLGAGSYDAVAYVGGELSNTLPVTLAPRIAALSPAAGPVNTLLTISGQAFGPAAGSVTVGGGNATIVAWYPAKVTVSVPALPAGQQPVVLTVNGVASNASSFKVTPYITTMTPAGGVSGTSVVLSGTSFGAEAGNQVLFGNVPAATTAWSDTEITALVPADAPHGNVLVRVVVAGAASNSLPFANQRPWIDERYPESGTVGTNITLVGRDFGAVSGSATIGGIAATIQSWSPTTVEITVASGTPKGTQPIVLTGALGQSNPVSFTQRGSDVWIAEDFPEARGSHAAVWTGTEMVVWGGYNGIYLNSGARYNPATDSWIQTSLTNAPTGRNGHSAVWTGQEIVVWGGWNGAYMANGGRYSPSSDSWSAVSPATAPTARMQHSAIWTGSKMIVWGGTNGGYLNNGAQYDPAGDTWATLSSVNAPAGRSRHTAVWTGGQMIVWGGYCGTSCYSNTGGRYDPVADTWVATSTASAPGARYHHTAVWTGTKMVVWGGYGASALNTGGRYDPATNTWSSTTLTGAPVARELHVAVWSGDKMVVWGGADSTTVNSGGRYDPVTDTWSSTDTSNAPAARRNHTAVWAGDKMIVWGGYNGEDYLDSGSRYDPAADAWVTTNRSGTPVPREAPESVWTGSEMIVWGGKTVFNCLNTGGKYNPTTNSWVATGNSGAPSGRYMHTAVWTGQNMLVWGGYACGTWPDTGGKYDPATDSWVGMSPGGVITGREDHTAVWSGAHMIVWGGFYGSGNVNNGAKYDPATNIWSATSMSNVPTARRGHVAVWTGANMVVWGGGSNTGGRYDPTANTWLSTTTVGAPVGRDYATAVWTGSQMVVWGGTSGGNLNSGGRYDPTADSWLPTSLTGAPAARYAHTAVWSGSEMIVWGGFSGSALGSGGRYNPVDDSWSAVSAVNASQGRTSHTAVWDGAEMLVWGGKATNGYRLGSLGRYVP